MSSSSDLAARSAAGSSDALDAGRRARRMGRAWVGLRAVVTVHTLVIWAQPVLAGGYLAGNYDLLAEHARNADTVTYVGYAQVLAAALLWLLGGPRWPTVLAVLVVAAETVQYLAGTAGDLGLHIPLGVALVASTVVLTALAWRRPPAVRPGRPRRPGREETT